MRIDLTYTLRIRNGSKLLSLLMTLFVGTAAVAQNVLQVERNYDVIRKGDHVGMLKSSITNTPAGQVYYIESRVKVWMIINIKVNYDHSNLFHNGLLKKASMIRTVNGSIKLNNNLLWRPGGYACMDKDGDTSSVHQEIHYTVASLYFHEPDNLDKVFSEAAFTFLPLHRTGPHVYELTLPDGNKNFYTYENGICTHVKAETDHGTIYFVLKK